MGQNTSSNSQPQAATRGLRFALRVVALCGMMLLRAIGSEPVMTEQEVKALCLLNFTKYVEWPAGSFADAKSPIRIGIIGEKKMAAILKGVVLGKTIGERPVQILEWDDAISAEDCNVLFIGSAEAKRSHSLLEPIRTKNILTIGDSEQFANAGGIITFTKKENKVRFEVNLTAAHAAGLQISSKMLSLADAVRGRE